MREPEVLSALEFEEEDEDAKEKAVFEPSELTSDRSAEVFCFFCTFEVVELGADLRPLLLLLLLTPAELLSSAELC